MHGAFSMSSSANAVAPRLVTPSYARENMIRCGRTKFWAMVKAGTIRLVDVGVGRKMVDVSSIEALLDPDQKAAA
jgi:hypothetical protein